MYARVLKSATDTKKRKYRFVVKIPAEKQTGWQEVNMDIAQLDQRLEAARQASPAIREYIQKYSSVQPRDEQGRWMKVGYAIERLTKQFGADWMAALQVIEKEGAFNDLMEGTLDLFKLSQTPAMRGIMKKAESYAMLLGRC